MGGVSASTPERDCQSDMLKKGFGTAKLLLCMQMVGLPGACLKTGRGMGSF